MYKLFHINQQFWLFIDFLRIYYFKHELTSTHKDTDAENLKKKYWEKVMNFINNLNSKKAIQKFNNKKMINLKNVFS